MKKLSLLLLSVLLAFGTLEAQNKKEKMKIGGRERQRGGRP